MEEGSAVSQRGQSVAVESAAEKETFVFTKQWCALLAMCTAISTAHRKYPQRLHVYIHTFPQRNRIMHAHRQEMS